MMGGWGRRVGVVHMFRATPVPVSQRFRLTWLRWPSRFRRFWRRVRLFRFSLRNRREPETVTPLLPSKQSDEPEGLHECSHLFTLAVRSPCCFVLSVPFAVGTPAPPLSPLPPPPPSPRPFKQTPPLPWSLSIICLFVWFILAPSPSVAILAQVSAQVVGGIVSPVRRNLTPPPRGRRGWRQI